MHLFEIIYVIFSVFFAFVSTFRSIRMLDSLALRRMNLPIHFVTLQKIKNEAILINFYGRQKNNNELTSSLNVCIVVNHFRMLHNV